MSHLRPTVGSTKQTKMKQNRIPPISQLPSISEEQIKIRKEKTIKPNSLPHIVPLPSNGKDSTVKFIQVSPINMLPKHEIPKLIRLNAIPLSGINNPDLPKFQMSKQAFEASNVKLLRTMKNIPVASSKIAGPLIQVFPKTTEKSVSGNMASSKNNLLVSSTNTNAPTNQAYGNFLPVTKSIPTILQRKSSVNTKNIADIGNKNIAPTRISSREKITPKLSNKSTAPISQETNIKDIETNTTEEKEPDESKPNNTPSTAKRKETEAVKSQKRKCKSPRKKRANKDSKDFTTEESIYVADGFREDVETLIEKCLQVYKLNFEKFTDIWKQMDFPCIFHGRQSSAELAELSEEVIHIAKAHMLAKNVSFEENIAGLFLVYALLNHQPFSKFASLRLVPNDVPLVLSLETQARLQKRHDVLYVLANVLIKGPCQFHVLAREVSLEPPYRKYYDGTVQVSTHLDSVFTRNAECVPRFKELISLEHRYQIMRQKLRDMHAGRDKVSNLCSRPAAKLLESYRAHIPRGRDCDLNPEQLINDIISSSKSSETRADLLKSIKEKAMTAGVDSMRHLTGVEERQRDSTSSSSESEESEIESKPTNRKPKIKGRGRSSASTLQELFTVQETTEETFVPEPARNEMPTLNDVEDLTLTEHKNKQTDKPKPTKRARTNKSDDSKNQSASKKRKLKSNIDSPTVKRKVTAKNTKRNLSDSTTDLIDIDDLISEKDKTETHLDISVEIHSDDDNYDVSIYNIRRKNVTESLSNDSQETLNQEINSTMPSITIEFEHTNEDPAIETIDESINTYKKENNDNAPKSKPVGSKDVSNNNSTSTKYLTRDKNSKKGSKIDKADTNNHCKNIPENINSTISKNNDTATTKNITRSSKFKKSTKVDKDIDTDNITKEITKKSQQKKDSSSVPIYDEIKSGSSIRTPEAQTSKRRIKSELDANKSPKRSGLDEINVIPPRRESPRIKNQKSLKTEEENPASKKRKNTCEGEGDIELEQFKVERKINVRLKSSLQKLGLLEMATDGEALMKKVERPKVGRPKLKSRLGRK